MSHQQTTFFIVFKLRLEALHQILVLLSGMEEKGSAPLMGTRQGSGFQSSSLLTSVRLQFLAGCFGLGTVGHAGSKGESVRLHHYQVRDLFKQLEKVLVFHFLNLSK